MFYVAITRAKKELVLSSYERSDRPQRLSRLIQELSPSLFENATDRVETPLQQPPRVQLDQILARQVPDPDDYGDDEPIDYHSELFGHYIEDAEGGGWGRGLG